MRKLSAPVAIGLMAALIGVFPLACGGSDAIKFGGGVTGTGGNEVGGAPGSGAGGATGAGGAISTGGGAGGSAGRAGAVGGEGGLSGAGESGGIMGAGGGGRETGGLSGGAGHSAGTGGASMSTGGAVGHGGATPTGGVVGSGGATAMGGVVGHGGTTATGGVVGTGGAASSGGISGSGGGGGQSGSACGTKLPTACADLDSAYTSELKAQLMCGTLLSKMECMKLVSSTIGCTCVKGFVVDDNCLMALQKRYTDQGCPSTCTRTAPPPTCVTPTSAKCMAQGLGLQSMCVSM